MHPLADILASQLGRGHAKGCDTAVVRVVGQGDRPRVVRRRVAGQGVRVLNRRQLGDAPGPEPVEVMRWFNLAAFGSTWSSAYRRGSSTARDRLTAPCKEGCSQAALARESKVNRHTMAAELEQRKIAKPPTGTSATDQADMARRYLADWSAIRIARAFCSIPQRFDDD